MDTVFKKPFIDKFCILKADYLGEARKEILKTRPTAKVKDGRPHLIVELKYKGKPQLFAIPTQTSVKPSLGKEFCHRLPSRLETGEDMQHALLYSSMLPIPYSAIKEYHSADTKIPNEEDKRLNVFHNVYTKKADAFPEKSRPSFEFLKKELLKKGMAAYDQEPFKKAFGVIAKALHHARLSYTQQHLGRIKAEAQNYITNHYEKLFVTNTFVDMPFHYTNVEALMAVAEKYARAGAEQQAPTAALSQTSTAKEHVAPGQYVKPPMSEEDLKKRAALREQLKVSHVKLATVPTAPPKTAPTSSTPQPSKSPLPTKGKTPPFGKS